MDTHRAPEQLCSTEQMVPTTTETPKNDSIIDSPVREKTPITKSIEENDEAHSQQVDVPIAVEENTHTQLIDTVVIETTELSIGDCTLQARDPSITSVDNTVIQPVAECIVQEKKPDIGVVQAVNDTCPAVKQVDQYEAQV